MGKFKIEPVSGRRQHDAVRFLIAGSHHDDLVEAQAQALQRRTIAAQPLRSQLWWARTWMHCLAAALVYENAGRTGILFASPAMAPGVDAEALVELEQALCRFALGCGLSLVQSLLPPAPEADADKAMLVRAGFVRLAELTYMNWDISRYSPGPPNATGLTMHPLDRCGEDLLGEVILASYRESLDCPGLGGLRQVKDIIAGHRASGVFHPQSWWIAKCDNQPAGCLLLNDCPTGIAADVVYLGVVPEFRRRGLARAMLHHAAADARRRGMDSVTLAVDAANRYAVGLYLSVGFRGVYAREAYIFTGK